MTLRTLFEELKLRKVRKTLAIYLGSALTTIGIVKLFVETYGLSDAIIPIIVTILTCGLVSAFVFAWFHGKEGVQRFTAREILIHSLVGSVAVVAAIAVRPAQKSSSLPKNGQTVAVLPFKNLSDNKEDEYFSDGITEDILTQLAKISSLDVISRTSVMKYKNVERNIREIADELGATAILQGSVRRMGDRVRITGQLIYARDDKHLWAETYDREMKDIFAIQTDVARRIAAALQAKLLPAEAGRLERQPTQNLDAYGYYLQGREFYYRHEKEKNDYAIELFKKALALDPQYALAYSGLADAYVQRYQRYGMELGWADSSIVLSKRAIDLDPNIPDAYKSLAMAYYQKEWYTKSIEQNQKALELNPNFAAVYSNMGELMDWVGRHDEAIVLIKKAMKLQPGRAIDYVKLGSAYFSLGLDSLAMARYQKALELQPGIPSAFVGIAETYARAGEVAQARAILDTALISLPDDPVLLSGAGGIALQSGDYAAAGMFYEKVYRSAPDYFGLLAPYGFALLKTGRKAEGERMLDRCIQTNMKAIEDVSEDYFRRYQLAQVYALRNDVPTALRWLREAIPNISLMYSNPERDPLLENLYKNSEFRTMMQNFALRLSATRERVLEQEHMSQQPPRG